MKESRLYGAELDGLTGRIAKQLYPHADIKITGFENTSYPNDFFDVAVGNVPFGQYKVSDRQYDKHNFLIHDYFLQRHWIRSDRAALSLLSLQRGQWIRKIRKCGNTLHSGREALRGSGQASEHSV